MLKWLLPKTLFGRSLVILAMPLILHGAGSSKAEPGLLSWMEASLPLDPLDDKQRTPLMVAAHAGATYMCALLIAKGADVRRQDRDGWTCLHHAADSGHDKVVDYL